MIRIPPDRLSPDTLDAVIEAFVLREGTDYGDTEVPLEEKVAQVRRQIGQGDIVVVYDESLEACNLLTKSDFLQLNRD